MAKAKKDPKNGSAPQVEDDRDPVALIASIRERLSRWQHFTNHDAIEAAKELDLLESQL